MLILLQLVFFIILFLILLILCSWYWRGGGWRRGGNRNAPKPGDPGMAKTLSDSILGKAADRIGKDQKTPVSKQPVGSDDTKA